MDMPTDLRRSPTKHNLGMHLLHIGDFTYIWIVRRWVQMEDTTREISRGLNMHVLVQYLVHLDDRT